MSVLLLDSPVGANVAKNVVDINTFPNVGLAAGAEKLPNAGAEKLSDAGRTPLPMPMLRSVAGVVGLGLAAGMAGQEAALASAPAGLLTGAGVLLLTTPALVVGHQYLRMRAAPGALIGALWDGFSRAGVVALGAVPAVALVAATSNMGPGLGLVALCGTGALGTLYAIRNLATAETEAGGSPAGGVGIAVLWAGLAFLIGLRLLTLFSF